MRKKDADSVHAAVMRRSLPELTRAIARGGQVDALDRAGRTPLFYAVQEGDMAIVAELVRLGANVNARDKSFETPLHFAPARTSATSASCCWRRGQVSMLETLRGTRRYFAPSLIAMVVAAI
jgi:ankyrin repeat protein